MMASIEIINVKVKWMEQINESNNIKTMKGRTHGCSNISTNFVYYFDLIN